MSRVTETKLNIIIVQYCSDNGEKRNYYAFQTDDEDERGSDEYPTLSELFAAYDFAKDLAEELIV